MELKAKVLTSNQPFTVEQLCLRYAGYAKDYANAAMALEDQGFFSVRYYLFGHAFELILKSFILSKGADEKKIRSINHSLSGAYDEAIRLGYVPTNSSLADLISWLNPFHEHQDLRYGGRDGFVIMPDAGETMKIFRHTHADILPLAKAFYRSRRGPARSRVTER